jgi:sRNA-binding regulator protein Hfq
MTTLKKFAIEIQIFIINILMISITIIEFDQFFHLKIILKQQHQL